MTQYEHVRATQLIGTVPTLTTKYETQLKIKVGIRPGCENQLKVLDTETAHMCYHSRFVNV